MTVLQSMPRIRLRPSSYFPGPGVEVFSLDIELDDSYRDGEVGRVGYEINFNRYFYQYVLPRPPEGVEAEIAGLLKEVAG